MFVPRVLPAKGFSTDMETLTAWLYFLFLHMERGSVSCYRKDKRMGSVLYGKEFMWLRPNEDKAACRSTPVIPGLGELFSQISKLGGLDVHNSGITATPT